MHVRAARLYLGLVALAFPLAAQSKVEMDIPANKIWTDTGIDIQAGETLTFTGTGEATYLGQTAGPEGLRRGWMDQLKNYPVQDSGRGALIGRIGDRDTSRAFLIGAKRQTRAGLAGRLFIGVNQTGQDSGTGNFHVVIERAPPAATTSAPAEVKSNYTQELLDSYPARVSDKEGTPGDRTNFVIVGSEDKVKAVLQAAGWVKVDKDARQAILRGLLTALSKQAYVTLPMSELMLFGRSQDYGFAMGDPLRVILSRHHFRIWRAPFTLAGQPVWVGAGTHDIGFDRDQRNNGVTHKIDPNTDLEREFIGQSMFETGEVALLDYMTRKDPVTKAKTAHGEEFNSDGRTLIVYLKGDGSNVSATFGDYFCSVLKQNNPDTGDWGACSQWIDSPGKEDMTLPALSNKYKVLIVPGFMSSCFADSPAFKEGQEALNKQYAMSIERLEVTNDTSEENAKKIGAYLRDQIAKDPRKYILIGYSKGAPDVMTALIQEQGIKDSVSAFISVAGAIGGSPVAEALPGQADKYMKQYSLPGCKGDMSQGFKSLQKSVRQAFNNANPVMPVPSYSIAAVSGKDNTSKMLAQTWQMLQGYDNEEDGQLLKPDATIQNGKNLGAAKSDHFAIALPFEKSSDASIKKGMDKGHFPRAALLEALLRFVNDDIK